MKQKNNFIVTILIVITIIILALTGLEKTIGPTVTTILSTFITLIGTVVIWVQLKKSTEQSAIDVVTQMNKLFLTSEWLVHFKNKLSTTDNAEDFSNNGILKGKDITYKEDSYIYDDNLNTIEYLEFFENLAVMVFDGVIKIRDVDSLFGDAFFVAMNNKYIQDAEIIPYYEHYKNIICLHKSWTKFRLENEIAIPYNETTLSKNFALYDEIKRK